MPENKKEEYLTNLISFVTKEFEEKYPLILAKLPRLAENIKKEYDELLARLKVSEDVGKLILIEEFLDRFSKLDSDLFKEKTYEKTYNKAIVDKFAELRTEYDNVGMKFYKIDLKIDQVERLIQSGARQDVVEKELEILSMLISNFKKDASECKRLLESFSSFLQKARSRISNRYDFDMLESYKESLKDLYYECNFDEFKKRYIEAENLARNIVLKSFPYRKEDFLKRSFKDFFDDFFDRC